MLNNESEYHFETYKEYGKNVGITGIDKSLFEVEVRIPEQIGENKVIAISFWTPKTQTYINKLVVPKTISRIFLGYGDCGVGVCYQNFEIDKKNRRFITDGYSLLSKDKSTLLYFNNTVIEAYEIPKGVKRVVSFGKVSELSLKKLVIPDSVCLFETSFWGCNNLLEVAVDTRMGFGPFGLSALKNTPWFKEKFSKEEFYCEEVESGYSIRAIFPKSQGVIVPEVVNGRVVKEICIAGMEDIESMYIPATVEHFRIITQSDIPFMYETYPIINSFKVDLDNPCFVTDGIGLYSKDMRRLIYLNSNLISEYVIPEGVEVIELYAIGGMQNLKSITLPSSLLRISASFHLCSNLVDVSGGKNVMEADHKGEIAVECPWLDARRKFAMELVVGKVLLLCDRVYPDDIYKISKGIEVIAQRAFERTRTLYNVKHIEIPEGVKTIKQEAFIGNYGIEEVILPRSMETIEGRAFANCKALSKVICKSTVINIDKSAFEGCEKMQFVSVADGELDINCEDGSCENSMWNRGD